MPGPLFYDRVKETTVTTGTGTLTLAGAVADFRSFSSVGDGNTCYYTIDDGVSNWEVGQGTYHSGGTLDRTSVLSSSNGNAPVNFGAGSKTVWLDVPAAFFTSIPNANLANSSLTVTAGTGLTGGGAISLGSSGTVSLDLTHANIWTAVQTVNLNAASVPTPSTGTGIELVGTDATIARVETTAFGANAAVTLRRADGTGAAPTAVTTSDVIGALNWHGYYASGWSNSQASIEGLATQAWTSAHMGTQIVLLTTPNNSTTLTTAVTIGQDQSATFANVVNVTTGTITTSQPALNVTQTWNAGGVTFTGIKLNVINTASASSSLLLDLQAGNSGGASKFNVQQDGSVAIAGNFFANSGTVNAAAVSSPGIITTARNNITTTSTDGIVLSNATVSTVSVQQQYSPRQHFISHAWNTTATAADNFVEFINELRPQAGTTPTGNLVWSSRVSAAGSGSFTDVMTLTTGGNLSLGGNTLTFPNVAAISIKSAFAAQFTINLGNGASSIYSPGTGGMAIGCGGVGTTTISYSIDGSGAVLASFASAGIQIATTTSQKLGIWNATPIVQPTTAIAASTFVANTSGTLNDSATWDGYTVGQVVKALRNTGLLA